MSCGVRRVMSQAHIPQALTTGAPPPSPPSQGALGVRRMPLFSWLLRIHIDTPRWAPSSLFSPSPSQSGLLAKPGSRCLCFTTCQGPLSGRRSAFEQRHHFSWASRHFPLDQICLQVRPGTGFLPGLWLPPTLPPVYSRLLWWFSAVTSGLLGTGQVCSDHQTSSKYKM